MIVRSDLQERPYCSSSFDSNVNAGCVKDCSLNTHATSVLVAIVIHTFKWITIFVWTEVH